MGYESKFYAVKSYNFPEKGLKHSQIIATLDMCKMGYGDNVIAFRKLFDTETPFSIYIYDYDTETEEETFIDVSEDKYGERLKYISDKKKGIEFAKRIVDEDDYWRFKILLEFMRTFADYDDVYIVHYGY